MEDRMEKDASKFKGNSQSSSNLIRKTRWWADTETRDV